MKLKNWRNQMNRNYLIFESSRYVYDFRKFQEIRSFGDSNFSDKITVGETDKKQSNLLNAVLSFNNKVRPRSKADEEKKVLLMKV